MGRNHPAKLSMTKQSHQLIQKRKQAIALQKEIKAKSLAKPKATPVKQTSNQLAKQLKKQSNNVYALDRRILLLGEGNCSFAKALIDSSIVSPHLMTVTTFDSLNDMMVKYTDSSSIVQAIKQAGARVIHSVDATKLHIAGHSHDQITGHSNNQINNLAFPAFPDLYQPHPHVDDCDIRRCSRDPRYDLIVFNFPHTGAGIKDEQENIEHHQKFLASCFKSIIASHLLKPVTGQLHITIKRGEPYNSWKIPNLAAAFPELHLKNAVPFDFNKFPGYAHRRTIGFKSGLSSESNEEVSKGAITYIFTRERNDTTDDFQDACDANHVMHAIYEAEKVELREAVKAVVSQYDLTGATTVEGEEDSFAIIEQSVTESHEVQEENEESISESTASSVPVKTSLKTLIDQSISQSFNTTPAAPLSLPPPPPKQAKKVRLSGLLFGKSKSTSSKPNKKQKS